MRTPSATPEPRARYGQRAFYLVAALVPALAVFFLHASFTHNHFYLPAGPYLHDAGWNSAVIWRQGFLPSNPAVATTNPDYYGIHVSLLVSLASMLSYAFPWDRVDYYAVFQGTIYALLALSPALLVGASRDGSLRRALGVAGAALAFSLNGQVLACAGFPHFEIALSAGVCLMLAGLAARRPWAAWLGLALAVATREDGGLHAASFLVVVLACDLLGRPFPVRRRTVLTMGETALAGSALAFAAQEAFFHPADLFRLEYLGTPIYGHLSGAVLAARAKALFTRAPFVTLAFAASLGVAVWKRDARYLLGWLAELPWLVLNVLAAQQLKSELSIYTGFPFVSSIFWVGAYGLVRGDGVLRRLSSHPRAPGSPIAGALVPLVLVSLVSTAGWYAASPPFARAFIRELVPRSENRRGLRAFARALRDEPRAFGNIYVDGGVAAWALEKMPAEMRLFTWDPNLASEGHDGIAFFERSQVGRYGAELMLRTPFTSCGRIEGPNLYFCTRPGRALPPGFEPRSLLADELLVHENTTRRGLASFHVDATPRTEFALHGPFVPLAPGLYTAAWDVRLASCTSAVAPRVDVFAGTSLLGARELGSSGTVQIDFEVASPGPSAPVELRAFSGGCAFDIDAVRLEARVTSPATPRAL